MGRGDSRTRKGKIFKGSYGNSRPRKEENTYKPTEKPVKAEKAEAPKAKAKAEAKPKAAAKKKTATDKK
jgi:30S ribosomal protein S31